MSKRVSGIELVGLEPLTKALNNLPKEIEANVVRTVARKVANKIVSLARRLFKFSKTGVTKRTFGILKVKDRKQMFIEVGVKGRSIAWIFMLGAYNRKHKSGAETGDIKPIGNVIQEAAGSIGQNGMKEMQVDLGKQIGKGLKKYLK